MTTPELELRARQFAAQVGTLIEARLGFGSDGTVWQTARKTAIKVFERSEAYDKELAVYRRLRKHGLRKLGRYAVPVLANSDDGLMVIEITIVEPPYILDFGKVYIDRAPDFSAEVMADFFAKQKELWGQYWPEIKVIWNQLKSMGIFHMDPKPGNIMPDNYNPVLDDD